MVNMNLGIFSDTKKANDAVNELIQKGFDPKQISIVMKGEGRDKILIENPGNDTNMISGAGKGATTGGVIGGLAGLLVGLGAITIPGIGALLIGGPIAAALGITGVGATTVSGAVTGALAGGVVGALTHIGVPKETAQKYESDILSGGVLLAVPADTSAGTVDSRGVLEKHGAEQISTVNVKEKSDETIL